LISEVQFFSDRGLSKTCTDKICELNIQKKVSPQSIENFENAIVVPDLPSTSFDICKIIRLNYHVFFRFGAQLLRIPVVLGTKSCIFLLKYFNKT
jgi:hypothetical protein